MFTLYERIQIKGIMPERALLRLKREGIALYDIKKTQKNQLFLRVQRKDLGKIFSIYPTASEGEGKSSIYSVRRIGAVGIAKIVDFCQRRKGCLLGILVFGCLTLTADSFVFGVEFVGTDVYARETMQALRENGIKPFAPYKQGKEDVVTAKILSLDFVEFCSVQKVGGRIRVETRVSPYVQESFQKGAMQAKHTGEILSLTVLRGTALKKMGDIVQQGESLVGDWFFIEEGGQVCVEPIARVKIACVYEGIHAEADTKEQAFAQAYLSLNISEDDELINVEVTPFDGIFHVKIYYVVTESMNV